MHGTRHVARQPLMWAVTTVRWAVFSGALLFSASLVFSSLLFSGNFSSLLFSSLFLGPLLFSGAVLWVSYLLFSASLLFPGFFSSLEVFSSLRLFFSDLLSTFHLVPSIGHASSGTLCRARRVVQGGSTACPSPPPRLEVGAGWGGTRCTTRRARHVV